MSLLVDVEIESTDTAIKRCTQALIDCGATGCFIDIEWAKLSNIPHPLTKPIPIYNVDGTANDAGAITDIANIILWYENHSECTQLAVTCLGKQSLILGYNWLHNHNPEINWQTKDVKMSCCPLQCSTCKVEDERDAEVFTKNSKPKGFEDIVLMFLHTYADVFSETAFDSLPEHRKWDHAIELEHVWATLLL
jgi:predicted aspartyl protease